MKTNSRHRVHTWGCHLNSFLIISICVFCPIYNFRNLQLGIIFFLCSFLNHLTYCINLGLATKSITHFVWKGNILCGSNFFYIYLFNGMLPRCEDTRAGSIKFIHRNSNNRDKKVKVNPITYLTSNPPQPRA